MFGPNLSLGRGLRLLLVHSDKSDLLVRVLGRRDKDILGIGFEDEHIMDVGVVIRAAASESPEDYNGHHPEHAEKDTDAASLEHQ